MPDTLSLKPSGAAHQAVGLRGFGRRKLPSLAILYDMRPASCRLKMVDCHTYFLSLNTRGKIAIGTSKRDHDFGQPLDIWARHPLNPKL